MAGFNGAVPQKKTGSGLLPVGLIFSKATYYKQLQALAIHCDSPAGHFNRPFAGLEYRL